MNQLKFLPDETVKQFERRFNKMYIGLLDGVLRSFRRSSQAMEISETERIMKNADQGSKTKLPL
ncbi:MAG TPA: hypothetical protein VGR47_16245 [Terracidiphilus sp.]|nr:hypothetical protein [Terracidiphilus sp.]